MEWERGYCAGLKKYNLPHLIHKMKIIHFRIIVNIKWDKAFYNLDSDEVCLLQITQGTLDKQ